MNDLIQSIYAAGMHEVVYNIFFVAGFVSVFLFVVLYGRKVDIKVWESVTVVLTVYPIVVALMFVMCWAESGFALFGGNNIVRVFVYVPLVAYPVSKFLYIPAKNINSVLAFGPVAQHAISHFGCMFVGCCAGYPSDWGLYNVMTKDVRFPNQPMEALLAWAIIIFLLVRGKKRNYVPDGREYPLMLVLFGGSRFLCEFLRDNEKIWLGCSSLAFHALFMFVVGVVWLIVLKRREQKEALAAATEE